MKGLLKKGGSVVIDEGMLCLIQNFTFQVVCFFQNFIRLLMRGCGDQMRPINNVLIVGLMFSMSMGIAACDPLSDPDQDPIKDNATGGDTGGSSTVTGGGTGGSSTATGGGSGDDFGGGVIDNGLKTSYYHPDDHWNVVYSTKLKKSGKDSEVTIDNSDLVDISKKSYINFTGPPNIQNLIYSQSEMIDFYNTYEPTPTGYQAYSMEGMTAVISEYYQGNNGIRIFYVQYHHTAANRYITIRVKTFLYYYKTNKQNLIEPIMKTFGIYVYGTGGAIEALRQQDRKKLFIQFKKKFLGSTEVVFAMTRILPNGKPDLGFGNGGTVTLQSVPSGYRFIYYNRMALTPDGKIIVAGVAGTEGFTAPNSLASLNRLTLMRLLPNGDIDTSFGENGFLFYPVQIGQMPYFRPYKMVFINNDKFILVGGDDMWGLSHVAIAMRFNRDGSIDQTFGNQGKIEYGTNIDSTEGHRFSDFALQEDGKLVLGGYYNPQVSKTQYYQYFVIRVNPDGSLDPSFANNGYLYASERIGNVGHLNNQWVDTVDIRPNGKILISGSGSIDKDGITHPYYTMAQLKSNGSFDPTFGNNGYIWFDDFRGYSFSQSGNVLLLKDNKILVAGYVKFQVIVKRLNENGSIDQSFADDGTFSFEGFVDLVGKIMPVGLFPVASPQVYEMIGAASGGKSFFFRFKDDGSIQLF